MNTDLVVAITGASGNVSNGSRVRAIADDESISLFVGNSKIASTYTSASNFKTEISCKVISEGTGGDVTSLIAYPRDVSALLPSEV